jgi:hypothetical protein
MVWDQTDYHYNVHLKVGIPIKYTYIFIIG